MMKSCRLSAVSHQLMSILSLVLLLTVTSVKAQSSTPPEERDIILGGLSWSPDSQMIAVAARDGVWIYDASTLEEIYHWDEHEVVISVAWSPDGERLATMALGKRPEDDEGLYIWEFPTGQIVYSLHADSKELIGEVAWSPDGTFFADVNRNFNRLHIWNATSNYLRTLDYDDPRYSGSNFGMDWSFDSTKVIVAGQNPILVWDIQNGELATSWNNDRQNNAVKWRPNSDMVAVGVADGDLELRDASSGELSRTLPAKDVLALAWNNDGTLLASIALIHSSSTDLTQIWNIETGEVVAEFQSIELRDGFYNSAIAWSPDGSKLASVSSDGKVYMWDGETFEPLGVYQLHAPLN